MKSEILKSLWENDRLFHQAHRIAGLGWYVLDIPTGRFKTSKTLRDIFGITEDYPHTIEGWVALIHPDDRKMMADYFSLEVVGLRRRFDKEYRIIRVVDGVERWLHGHGDLELDANNRPIMMTGTIQDITERKNAERALQQSETRYRELIELAVDGILVGSGEGVILEANRCMCVMTGLSREELVGKHIGDVLFTPESLLSKPLRFDLLKKGEIVVSERQIIHKDGTLASIEMRTKMMPDGTYQSIYRDITERKTLETSLLNFTKTLVQRVEERTKELKTVNATLQQNVVQLRASQALLNDMGNMANVGGWELDIHSGKQLWTDEVYHIHELEKDFEPTGQKGIAFYAPDVQKSVEEAVRRCIELGEPFDFEHQLITAKGNTRWVHSIGKADIEHGRIYGTFQDVTVRRLADQELREKNAALDHSVSQLRKLSLELTQAEELERKRVASILHDHVQQYSVAATMKISLLDGQLTPIEQAKGVKESLAILREALDASRSLTVSLCPPVLMDAGLLPCLKWLASWMEKQHGLTVKLSGTDSHDVPGPLCNLLFQAVRELLFNIVKHAKVKAASVMLEHPDAQSLRVIVCDHGKGFSLAGLSASSQAGGLGLFHLQERLTSIGGTLEMNSEVGHGTRVSITVPLQ